MFIGRFNTLSRAYEVESHTMGGVIAGAKPNYGMIELLIFTE